jgi:hypothetical protein
VKNITVSVDDESYRRARMKAAEDGVSVSAVVRKFLVDFAAGGSEFERAKSAERQLRDSIVDFDAANRLPRDQLHARR